MHKILVIDDDVALTQLLREYLEQQLYDVTVENNPVIGIQAIKDNQFDLVLLDVMMPEMDGFTAIGEIRKFSKIPIIILTAKGDDFNTVLGLEMGADDYLSKPFNHRELLARIKALIRRLSSDGVLSNRELYSVGGIVLNANTQDVRVNDRLIDMTATEFLLLFELIKGKGRLLSKEFLCERALGRRLTAFDRSLDMHISNLRKKLASQGLHDIIKTVRSNGYLLKSEQFES